VISPEWIYIFSFLLCIIFSLLTGTSWGSAGTIGIVMIGISQVYGADLAITAGAIVGGSFFLKSGFNTSMSSYKTSDQSVVLNILNRGGLYNLIEGVMTCLLIFTYIGLLDAIDAINVSLSSIMKKINKSYQLVATTLTATWLINITTSNQYATSFIVGSAFKEKYDKLKVDKKVLSRSIEDAGTMMENLVPWTPSGIFMASTLGVAAFDYAPYQFISLINIVIAYLFAFTGIAIFKKL